MQVPLLDLRRQYQAIKSEIDSAIAGCLEHTRFILGPEVETFERNIAAYCGTSFAVGVASGTDALLLSLHALEVGPGDEVITSSFSFFASAGVISRMGAKPVFVDIDLETFNLLPREIEKVITSKTKVIIPVHLFGQTAEMGEIMELAREYDLKVVEDAAQAIGAKYKGKKAGSIGNCGCFSFFPSKNLGAYGDGGMVVSNDEEFANRVRRLRVHGFRERNFSAEVGYNSRLDTLQAAILNVKLKHLDSWTEARREKAHIYSEALKDCAQVKTPLERDHNYHIFHQYTLRAENREGLRQFLKEKNVGTATYYPLPLHLQECFKDLGYKPQDLSNSERASREVVSLPAFPELTETEQGYVVEAILEFYRK
jgi:dTDP-4-amino-4,6-dideoxygalactose transaminase